MTPLAGFFEQHSVETHLANFHCNLTANIHLTHYLYSRLISKARIMQLLGKIAGKHVKTIAALCP